MKIGFIARGKIGTAIAGRLIKTGHHVCVWNRSPGPVDEHVRRGAEAAAQPADAARSAAAGLIHLNLATVSVRLGREFAELHRQRKVGSASVERRCRDMDEYLLRNRVTFAGL